MSERLSRGFTLIELLVVIAIIGILSSVVLASLNSARVKGRDARRISDMRQMQLALELYQDINAGYPVTALGIDAASTSLAALVTNNFISSIPSDPTNTGIYVYQYVSANSDGTACTVANCESYLLKAMIEGVGGTPAGDVDDDGGALAASIVCNDPAYCVRP